MAKKLTAADLKWLEETYEDALEETSREGWEPYEGEVVMTSLGYVELSGDGTVWMYGREIADVG